MDLIEHRVRERAYYIWEDEGRVHGRADAHWLRAEAEIAAPAPILTVQAVAATSLAPSPAKTLKPKAGAKAGSAKSAVQAAVEAKPAKVAAKVAAKPAAKTVSTKTTSTKSASTKTASTKTAAPKAPKALAAAKPKSTRAATGASLH